MTDHPWATRLALTWVVASAFLTAFVADRGRVPVRAGGTTYLTYPAVTADHTLYGYPLPCQGWTSFPTANTTTWRHDGTNYPLVACLLVAAWLLPPAAWRAVRRRWADPPSRRAARLWSACWAGLAAAGGGMAAAAVTTVVFGWSVYTLAAAAPGDAVYRHHYRAFNKLHGLHLKVGLKADWPTYSLATCQGMVCGAAAGALLTRRAAFRACSPAAGAV